jgi:hypothetical protein
MPDSDAQQIPLLDLYSDHRINIFLSVHHRSQASKGPKAGKNGAV